MPIGDVINRLARAYMARERAKAGIPAQEQTAQAAATDDLVKRAKLALLTQQMGFEPADRALNTRYKEAQIGQMEAHSDYYRNPRPGAMGSNTEPITDPNTGNTVGYRSIKPGPDGEIQFWNSRGVLVGGSATGSANTPPGSAQPSTAADPSTAPLPASVPDAYRKNPKPAPRRELRKRLPIRVTEYDAAQKKNVIKWYDPDTNEEVKQSAAPLPAAEGKQIGIVGSVADQVNTMERLAANTGFNGMTAPVTGGFSKLKAEVTREGDPADFDYAAKLAKDIVYFKTGAQLNQTEQSQLEQVIPNRARGNLPGQVVRFKAYVSNLFAKYGIEDDMTPGHGPSPVPGGARPGPAAGGGAPRRIKFDAQGNRQ